ncbi:MAG TPA: hypothetical protein HA252_03655 [Candidatus Diapherotrites archaeon]|uniref:Uncharacterized protein n=1 Tax=Candidatus Iainarchaeum sp. TaxID=3101447 RepID=A0A7J4JGN1_9ARCH|nr:hypothetical protein [Candidatus Diapherotrites archaeon]HIH16474.1 hypothetical protein [Candidatus Diapherotrites archaeon]
MGKKTRATKKNRDTRKKGRTAKKRAAPAQRIYPPGWPVKGKVLSRAHGVTQWRWHLGKRELMEKITMNPESAMPVRILVSEHQTKLANARLERRQGPSLQSVPQPVRRIIGNRDCLEASWYLDAGKRRRDARLAAHGALPALAQVTGRGIAGRILGPAITENLQALVNQGKKSVVVMAAIQRGNVPSERIAKRQGFALRHVTREEAENQTIYMGYWLKTVRPH